MYNFAFEKPTNMQAEPKPYKLPPINYIGIDPSFLENYFTGNIFIEPGDG